VQHVEENMLLSFSFGFLSTYFGDVRDEHNKMFHHKISTMEKCHQEKHTVTTADSLQEAVQIYTRGK
jgi:hypothetical protein